MTTDEIFVIGTGRTVFGGGFLGTEEAVASVILPERTRT